MMDDRMMIAIWLMVDGREAGSGKLEIQKVQNYDPSKRD
jgi:hypothetical protein